MAILMCEVFGLSAITQSTRVRRLFRANRKILVRVFFNL